MFIKNLGALKINLLADSQNFVIFKKITNFADAFYVK